MAKNLAAKTQGDLLVYDVNKAAVEKFIEQYPKAKPAESPADLADKASTVITMLPEAAHVQSVYASLIDAIDQESLLIDSSTIDAESARSLAKQVTERKATPFDAPVSGGAVGAENGTLTFMVGAPTEQDFEKIKPTLALMGRNSIHCGANGTGQVAKLCNNMLLAVSMIGVSEALLLAGRLGMDPKLLGAIINNSTGRCWSSDTNNPHPGVIPTAPANRDYAGGFANKLMAKDLRLAMKAAFDSGTTPILGTTAAQIYNDLSTMNDYGTLDFSSVYKVIQCSNKGETV
ncbi:3-hydroxyisobutyrate dehydrogenase [Phascolomyces articulosus]|uniref:3-hydroxyisobutyrate dehydrogenase n=1 Tax=Phascolomyces articulosus TaxID=60185 RepID=A0AAD5K7E0_9FUNG|nr:3-hydroxyisobutyrate dehydrogenase [Phascolomyces articulosus]